MGVTLFGLHQAAVNIVTTKQWNLLAFNLPSHFPGNDSQFYNSHNVVATGFAMTGNRFFLATPRLFSGVPATLSRIDFPREVVKGETLFTNMIIDETTSRPENNCDDAYVYITDTIKPAIVVYDSKRDLTWRLSHPAMYPDPNFAKPNILGHRFTLMDGIVGLGFDARAKVIYFQPLATDRLFSIKTSVLRAGPSPFGVDLPVNLIGKKSSQGIGLAVSPIDGSIYFSPMSETAVAKYNPVTNNQRPITMAYKRIKAPGYRFARNENYYNVKLGDFSGLRIAKNVSYDVSTFH
ncbi:hypothetical protein HA402_006546 [Bradysia odoriphaga]|nr:hypothetical protein HA402_006546 [Bradysia odoriphaga]